MSVVVAILDRIMDAESMMGALVSSLPRPNCDYCRNMNKVYEKGLIVLRCHLTTKSLK